MDLVAEELRIGLHILSHQILEDRRVCKRSYLLYVYTVYTDIATKLLVLFCVRKMMKKYEKL